MNEIQDRVFLLVKTKNFSSAEFADAIGVQPSNISHIMSGRNKPSLDLVMKILKKFPEIRTEWLLNGVGTMTKEYGLNSVGENAKTEKQPVKEAQQTLEFEQLSDNPDNNQQKTFLLEEVKDEKKEKIEEEREEKRIIEQVGVNERIIEKEPHFHHQEGKKNDPHKIYQKRIEKIVVFYEDRTFREYSPED